MSMTGNGARQAEYDYFHEYSKYLLESKKHRQIN